MGFAFSAQGRIQVVVASHTQMSTILCTLLHEIRIKPLLAWPVVFGLSALPYMKSWHHCKKKSGLLVEGVEFLSSLCPAFSAVSQQIFTEPFLPCPGIFQLSHTRSLCGCFT